VQIEVVVKLQENKAIDRTQLTMVWLFHTSSCSFPPQATMAAQSLWVPMVRP
jgi:hypothetical protein